MSEWVVTKDDKTLPFGVAGVSISAPVQNYFKYRITFENRTDSPLLAPALTFRRIGPKGDLEDHEEPVGGKIIAAGALWHVGHTCCAPPRRSKF